MAHNLTEADAFTTPISVPDGTDTHNTAANVVAALAQALANRTKHLNDHVAYKDVANTFSAAQTIPVLNATDLAVANSATFGNDLVIGDDIDAGGDIYAADDMIAGDEFQYATTPTRTKYLPLFRSFGEGVLDTIVTTSATCNIIFPSTGSIHIWPIELPKGATLTSVAVILDKTGTGTSTITLRRKQGYDWGLVPVANPNDFDIGSNAITTVGRHTLTAGFFTEVIDNNLVEYYAHYRAGDTGERVYGLRVTFVDPGPRNH